MADEAKRAESIKDQEPSANEVPSGAREPVQEVEAAPTDPSTSSPRLDSGSVTGPSASGTEPAQEETTPETPAETEELTTEQVLGMKIRPGMVLRVHQKIKEMTPKGDERERIQVFEGTVIARKGKDPESATITVRKVSGGIGVERIFPVKSPNIAKFEVVKEYRTRRSKLYFLRRGYKKRLKEKRSEKQ